MSGRGPVIRLSEKFEAFRETWTPKILAELNGQHVKIARLDGDFVWHTHEDEDELFLVLEGSLELEFEDGKEVLGPLDLYVVPRGVRHRPIANGEVKVLLFEPKATRNTGEVDEARSVDAPEWI